MWRKSCFLNIMSLGMALRWVHLPVLMLVLSLCLSPMDFHWFFDCTHCEHALDSDKIFFADAGADGSCLCGCHLKTDFYYVMPFFGTESCEQEISALTAFTCAGFYSFSPPPPRS